LSSVHTQINMSVSGMLLLLWALVTKKCNYNICCVTFLDVVTLKIPVYDADKNGYCCDTKCHAG